MQIPKKDREEVIRVFKSYIEKYSNPDVFPYSNYKGDPQNVNLFQDALGMVLIFSELSNIFIENRQNLKNIAHAYLNYCNRLLQEHAMLAYTPWIGLVGTSSVIKMIAPKDYKNFSNQLDGFIFNKDNFNNYIELQKYNIENNKVSTFDYDALYGISAFTRYLIFRGDLSNTNTFLDGTIKQLVKLLDFKIEDDSIPNCYITYQKQSEIDSKKYLNGHLDVSLSHGISGPLVALSMYYQKVKRDKKVEATIINTTQFLISLAHETNNGIIWPKKIPIDELKQKSYHIDNRNDSWCYGEVGIARAIFLAGIALGNKEFEGFAVRVFKSVCAIEPENLNLLSTTFCHGYAGLAHLVGQMYGDTKISIFKLYHQRLIDFILDTYEKEEKYKDILLESKFPGLLDGEGGVIMTLLNYLSQNKRNRWDWLFLIN